MDMICRVVSHWGSIYLGWGFWSWDRRLLYIVGRVVVGNDRENCFRCESLLWAGRVESWVADVNVIYARGWW